MIESGTRNLVAANQMLVKIKKIHQTKLKIIQRTRSK